MVVTTYRCLSYQLRQAGDYRVVVGDDDIGHKLLVIYVRMEEPPLNRGGCLRHNLARVYDGAIDIP